MRKKERIAAVAVLVAVAAIVLAGVSVDQEQQRQRAEAKAAAEAEHAEEDAKRTYAQGETVHVSSDDEAGLAFAEMQGSMDVTIRESKLYDSYEATGLPTGDGHFFGTRSYPDHDQSYYLVCVVDIINIDAEPTIQSKLGDQMFHFGGPEANAAEYVYFDGSEENAATENHNYFATAPGEEKTLTACWQIPQNDGWSNLPESVTLSMFGYLIELTPEDCRELP